MLFSHLRNHTVDMACMKFTMYTEQLIELYLIMYGEAHIFPSLRRTRVSVSAPREWFHVRCRHHNQVDRLVTVRCNQASTSVSLCFPKVPTLSIE